jgi:exopolysaccharide biosynthesis polyprenyl glycosylphosphotransferase
LRTKKHRWTALLLVCGDLISVLLVFNLVALTYLRGVVLEPIAWPLAAPFLVFALSIHLIDGYGANSDMLSLDYASMHLIASFFAALVTLLLTFAFIPAGFELQSSRAVIVIGFCILGPLSLTYRRVAYERFLISRADRHIVFAGAQEDFDAFSAECVRLGMKFPLIHLSAAAGPESFGSVLSSIAESRLLVEAIVVKESFKDLPPEVPEKLVQLCFGGIPTYTLEIFHQIYWRKIPLYRINPIWLFQEGFKVAREPVFERIKRFSDVVFAVLGLVVSAPVICLAAVAIKLDDGGPVFFVQSRVGRHKAPFQLIKLRTMRRTAGAGDPYTRQGDARITRVGKWLRTARLDELPQLWNVLKGEMSLIGPRAEWDRLVSDYEREIACYNFRHLVKPGITGWAQVNYRYGSGVQDTLRKLEYDLYYIRNYSFMLDASIVLKTIHVMLLRKGR